jgi:hypothetical protein
MLKKQIEGVYGVVIYNMGFSDPADGLMRKYLLYPTQAPTLRSSQLTHLSFSVHGVLVPYHYALSVSIQTKVPMASPPFDPLGQYEDGETDCANLSPAGRGKNPHRSDDA